MEVKPGYKQTEVGVIPNDWEVSTFGDVFDVTAGGDVDPKRSKSYQDEIHCYPIYSNALTNYGLYGYCSYADHPAATITITARGMVGSANFRDHPYTAIGRVLVLQPKSEIAGRYFADVINSRVKFANESTGVPQLTAPQISTYRLPVPPLPEQRAIARALSDVDALLGALDQLIAKKRDHKQAAVQQLLTGQTRLPGFHGDWEVKRLGDVFTISAGKSKSAFVVEDGDYWVCDMGSVSTEGRLIVSKQTSLRGDFLRTGDLIMPKDDIGGGKIIGKVGYIDANDTYVLGDHVYCLRALEGDPRFLAYVVNFHQTNTELRKKVIGSAQLGLGRRSVTEQEVQFPPTVEQTAIAEVLTDMDAELAALEQRRAKTRALKQGMMQELLTGKTRIL